MITLTVFLDRAMPDSRKAKPACMKNTSAPAATTQAMSVAALSDSRVSGGAASAARARPGISPAMRHNRPGGQDIKEREERGTTELLG